MAAEKPEANEKERERERDEYLLFVTASLESGFTTVRRTWNFLATDAHVSPTFPTTLIKDLAECNANEHRRDLRSSLSLSLSRASAFLPLLLHVSFMQALSDDLKRIPAVYAREKSRFLTRIQLLKKRDLSPFFHRVYCCNIDRAAMTRKKLLLLIKICVMKTVLTPQQRIIHER